MSSPSDNAPPRRGVMCKVRLKKRKPKPPVTLVVPSDVAEDVIAPSHHSINVASQETEQLSKSRTSPVSLDKGTHVEASMELLPIKDAETKEPLRDANGKVIEATHVVIHRSPKLVVPSLDKESIQAARRRHLEKLSWNSLSVKERLEVLRMRYRPGEWNKHSIQLARLPLDTEMMGVTVENLPPICGKLVQPEVHEQDPSLLYEHACSRRMTDHPAIHDGGSDLPHGANEIPPSTAGGNVANPFASGSGYTIYRTTAGNHEDVDDYYASRCITGQENHGGSTRHREDLDGSYGMHQSTVREKAGSTLQSLNGVNTHRSRLDDSHEYEDLWMTKSAFCSPRNQSINTEIQNVYTASIFDLAYRASKGSGPKMPNRHSEPTVPCNTLQEESVIAQDSEPQGPGIWGQLERLETTLPHWSLPPDTIKQQQEELRYPTQSAPHSTNQHSGEDAYTADIIDGMISGLQKQRDSKHRFSLSQRKSRQIPADMTGCSQQECVIKLRSQMNLPAPSGIDCRTPLCRRPIDWYCQNCISFICTKCSKKACGTLHRHDIIDFDEMYEDSKQKYIQWKARMERALKELSVKMKLRDQLTAEIHLIANATEEDLMSTDMAQIFSDLPAKRNHLTDVYMQIKEINDELNKYKIDINKVTPKYFIESFDIFDHCIRQTEKETTPSRNDSVEDGDGQNMQDGIKLMSGTSRHADCESSWHQGSQQ